ncbi:hypothetical protein THAOC_37181, partial [Thalassiosira oceanica]
AMGTVIGPPGEAMEELDSPYHLCCAVVPVEPTGGLSKISRDMATCVESIGGELSGLILEVPTAGRGAWSQPNIGMKTTESEAWLAKPARLCSHKAKIKVAVDRDGLVLVHHLYGLVPSAKSRKGWCNWCMAWDMDSYFEGSNHCLRLVALVAVDVGDLGAVRLGLWHWTDFPCHRANSEHTMPMPKASKVHLKIKNSWVLLVRKKRVQAAKPSSNAESCLEMHYRRRGGAIACGTDSHSSLLHPRLLTVLSNKLEGAHERTKGDIVPSKQTTVTESEDLGLARDHLASAKIDGYLRQYHHLDLAMVLAVKWACSQSVDLTKVSPVMAE